MILLSMRTEEKSWMILRGLRVLNSRERSTCSNRESSGLVKVTVSISPPLAWNRDKKYMYVHCVNIHVRTYVHVHACTQLQVQWEFLPCSISASYAGQLILKVRITF